MDTSGPLKKRESRRRRNDVLQKLVFGGYAKYLMVHRTRTVFKLFTKKFLSEMIDWMESLCLWTGRAGEVFFEVREACRKSFCDRYNVVTLPLLNLPSDLVRRE